MSKKWNFDLTDLVQVFCGAAAVIWMLWRFESMPAYGLMMMSFTAGLGFEPALRLAFGLFDYLTASKETKKTQETHSHASEPKSGYNYDDDCCKR